MEHLSESQESFCVNTGIFGILISASCMGQLFYFMIPHWISYTIIFVYILSITGFVQLTGKSVYAFPFLIASTILLLILEALMLALLTFSLVLLILLMYSIVITVLIFTNEIQKKLKQKKLFEKEEKEKWSSLLQ
ncbi:hypothetical protein BH11BAC4_BH11BAC4_21540 [soil metagenome]